MFRQNNSIVLSKYVELLKIYQRNNHHILCIFTLTLEFKRTVLLHPYHVQTNGASNAAVQVITLSVV